MTLETRITIGYVFLFMLSVGVCGLCIWTIRTTPATQLDLEEDNDWSRALAKHGYHDARWATTTTRAGFTAKEAQECGTAPAKVTCSLPATKLRSA